MELTYLKTFCEVAKHGSFTRAAELLGYAQSSITTQIQRLEESYGAVLVERFGRSMRLTIAGEALLPYAKEVLRLHEESKEVVLKQSKGTLSIGTIETLAAYYLPPYLQTYRQQYPDISIMLQPGNEPLIIEAVKEGTLDVGIILDPPFSDPELHTQMLREEQLVIIASPEHRFSKLSEVRAEDLAGEPLILTEDGCTYRAMLLKALRNSAVDSKPSYEFGNLEAIKQCVVYGLGVALLPRITVADEVQKQQLIALLFRHPDCSFYTQLIYSKKKWQSKAFLGFVDLLGGSNHQNL
ncbi:LysR family transcriptional regulator [Paenibacillus glycanilyticus]|uniref:LysR family transcriptional regulator n=1 Tax=Paenibacillus glycanilyticus TaxID=126569 RepID=UPI00203DAE90|nr:LysR family transcriptional regulator [Paenibacillus glycanilyticus]MCM3629610.1 LysR family transcriptional regulator [Paenibacillus glycanilyticus]